MSSPAHALAPDFAALDAEEEEAALDAVEEELPRPSLRTRTLAGTMSMRASAIRKHRAEADDDFCYAEDMTPEAQEAASSALARIRALFGKS